MKDLKTDKPDLGPEQLHHAMQAAIKARDDARELRMELGRLRAARDDWKAESIQRGRQLARLRAELRKFADELRWRNE